MIRISFLNKVFSCLFLLLFPFVSFAEKGNPTSGVVTLNDNNKSKVEGTKKTNTPLLKADYGKMKREVVKKVRADIIKEKLNNVVPITPDQIMEYKKKVDIGKKAAATPVNGKIKLINKTVPIILGKSDYDKTIYLSKGFVTTIVFLDVKGNPWPVKVAVKGDGDKISTTRTDKHIIFMSTSSSYSDTNMAFVLEGINIPINFRIVTNTNKANEKIEVILQDLGPEAKKESFVEESKLATVNNEMYNFLDMLPPEKATEVKLTGFHANAWVFNGNLYIRTADADLISPAYAPGGVVENGDNAKVYRLSYSPFVMFSYNGRVYQASIEVPNNLFNKEFGTKVTGE